MSAMEDMIGNMLKKALPPEVMQLLTPEKINEIGDGINAYIVSTRESLERIETQNASIIMKLEEYATNNKEIENVGSKGGGGSRKRSPRNGGGSGERGNTE